MMRVFVYEHLSGGAADAGGELLAAGRAMRDAVTRDLLRAGDCDVSVAAGPHAPEAPAPARAVSPPPGGSAADFVAQQARSHDCVWAIAPETGGVLAQLQRVVDAERWLGCDAEAIALSSSKRATLAHAALHGLTTPLAFASSPATRRWQLPRMPPVPGAGQRPSATRAPPLAGILGRRPRGRCGPMRRPRPAGRGRRERAFAERSSSRPATGCSGTTSATSAAATPGDRPTSALRS